MPAKPKKTQWIVAGLLVGLILGLSTAFLRESWDERLNTPLQVNTMLGLPMLGSMASLTQSAAGSTLARRLPP